MKHTWLVVLLPLVTTSALAGPPPDQSRLKGSLPPEIRLSPVATPGGAVEAFKDIAVLGHINKPSLVIVMARADWPTWDGLQLKQDFVPGILANAGARPF